MQLDLKKIKAFAFDVDGVMTDGGVLSDLSGELYRVFDSKDGFAIRMATMAGYPVAAITGGRSMSVRNRFISCGMKAEDIYLGSRNKMLDMHDFCARYGITPDELMYFGDDVPDIGVLKASGIGVCPSDAVEDVKSVADYVSPLPGGRGCIRDMFEKTMKAQGRWVFDVQLYTKKF